MRAFMGLLIAVALGGYSLAAIFALNHIAGEHPEWPWWRTGGWALFDAFGTLRDWVFDATGWLFGRARRTAPRAGRKAATRARSGRAAVNRWRADRRRPAAESAETVSRSWSTGTAAQPEPAPRQRTVVTPLRREPGPTGSGPVPSGGAGPAPVGAIHPVFGALISWILDREHPDSVDFEEFHRHLSTGFLSVGEAMHGYTEHLAEGGIGLDPIIVQAAAEVAEAASELSAGIVDIFRKFHAVYAGYLAWLEDGHQNTHDGRWVRPESA